MSASENVWSAANEQVTVHVWESRAKIRIKVSRTARTKLSMDRIAQIAVEAMRSGAYDYLRKPFQF